MIRSNADFIRRFAMHILPLRFVRIRQYDTQQYMDAGKVCCVKRT
jgi:hypothetical protein